MPIGKVYKKARVYRVEPDGINYMFTGGIVKIPFTDLPKVVLGPGQKERL